MGSVPRRLTEAEARAAHRGKPCRYRCGWASHALSAKTRQSGERYHARGYCPLRPEWDTLKCVHEGSPCDCPSMHPGKDCRHEHPLDHCTCDRAVRRKKPGRKPRPSW